jgi:hypothetical protein
MVQTWEAGTAATGSSGNVTVDATHSVELIGANPISLFASSLTTSTLSSEMLAT